MMLVALRPFRTCAADMSMLPCSLATTKAVAKCSVGLPPAESNRAPTYGTPPNGAAEFTVTSPVQRLPARGSAKCLRHR